MVVSRWDPFRDLMSIQNELNRLFGRTYAGTEAGAGSTGGAWVPPLDIFETKDHYVVNLELAGVHPDSVDVSVEDSTLTVSGERRLPNTFTRTSSAGPKKLGTIDAIARSE